jgi:8-oxo-dGTP pyrophosphatase MutT (NUDIX family)
MLPEDLARLQHNLPRHPNIMGKHRYFNAAVLIPLVEQKGELHFLFQKRAAHIRQGGEISFPGGGFEPDNDETCRQAAIRETVEELGISPELIHILGQLDTFVSPRGITVDSFLATLEIASLDDLDPDTNEVERLFLLPVSWFESHPPRIFDLESEIKPVSKGIDGESVHALPVDELGLPSRYKRPWQGMSHRVFVYDTPEETVWGITAELVQEVIRMLESGG